MRERERERNPMGSMSWGIALARRLSTASPAAAEEAVGYKPLYRRLSEVGGNPGGSVAETMKGWLREGRVVTEVELMRFVREFRKYKSYNTALELMDWMEKRGMRMSFGNHAIRLDLISKVKGIDVAERYFSSLPDLGKNNRTYGALLGCYCHKKMEDKAIALYEKMKELNLASNLLVHTNLMTLYMNLGRPEKVQTLFRGMKANNISPDNFAYCILMNSYASSNDISSAEKVVLEMKAAGFAFDWSIYANLASHYNSAGLFKKAESTLKKLEIVMYRHRRDRAAFHFLISLYAGAGNLSEVNRVWKSLKANFRNTTNMSYRVMLLALNKLDDIDALEQCFKEWESVCVTYDVTLVNIMIGAYLRKDMIREAESLRKRVTEKGCGTDFRMSELFMDYYLERREMGPALECFEAAVLKVRGDEWKLDEEKMAVFLKYFEEVGDADGAEVFRKSLRKLSCFDAEAGG